MVQAWKIYAGNILLAEAVGGLSGWLTQGGAQLYAQQLVKPPFSPPGGVFPVVWVALFALMGIGAARICRKPASAMKRYALQTYLWQLGFVFFWSIWFFGLQWYGFALLWLVALWVQIAWLIAAFRQLDRVAAWLQVPYFLWVFFAGYLNLGVFLLN